MLVQIPSGQNYRKNCRRNVRNSKLFSYENAILLQTPNDLLQGLQ